MYFFCNATDALFLCNFFDFLQSIVLYTNLKDLWKREYIKDL